MMHIDEPINVAKSRRSMIVIKNLPARLAGTLETLFNTLNDVR